MESEEEALAEKPTHRDEEDAFKRGWEREKIQVTDEVCLERERGERGEGEKQRAKEQVSAMEDEELKIDKGHTTTPNIKGKSRIKKLNKIRSQATYIIQ